MSVKIRLARGGAKKRPYYRIVIADIRMMMKATNTWLKRVNHLGQQKIMM